MTPHDLLENFQVLAEAPNGIQCLRELMLELAVGGKLVEQDPKDEPTEALLKRIQSAIGNGPAKKVSKGRKPRSASSSIAEVDLTTGPLPQNWSLCQLSDLIEFMDAGWSPACSGHATSSEEEWGVLKTTAIQANSFEPWHHKALPPPLVPRPECEVSPGDLLVTRAGPWFRVGVCCFVSETRPRLMLSDKIIRCRLSHGLLEGRWLALCINSGRASRFLRAKQTGMDAAQMNISQGRLASAPIEVPPLAEQRRILTRVEELMALLNRLEAKFLDREAARAAGRDSALSALHEAPTPNDVEVAWLRIQDRFNDLFITPEDIELLRDVVFETGVRGLMANQRPEDGTAGGLLTQIKIEKAKLVRAKKIRAGKIFEPIHAKDIPFEIPTSWVWTRLGEVGDWGAGATPTRSNTSYYGGPINWFKSGDLNDGHLFGPSSETITELALGHASLRKNQPGDVLIALYGATIGKLAILETEATANQAVCACTSFAGVYNRYLFLFLRAWRRRFIAQGAGGAQPNISKEKVIETVFPLPPHAEQVRVVARVDELNALIDHLAQELRNTLDYQAAFAAASVHHLETQ